MFGWNENTIFPVALLCLIVFCALIFLVRKALAFRLSQRSADSEESVGSIASATMAVPLGSMYRRFTERQHDLEYDSDLPDGSSPSLDSTEDTVKLASVAGKALIAHRMKSDRWCFSLGGDCLPVAYYYHSRRYTRKVDEERRREGYDWLLEALCIDELAKHAPLAFMMADDGLLVASVEESTSAHGGELDLGLHLILRKNQSQLEIQYLSDFNRDD